MIDARCAPPKPLRHAEAQRTVVVDLGETEIFEGKMAELMHGRSGEGCESRTAPGRLRSVAGSRSDHLQCGARGLANRDHINLRIAGAWGCCGFV
jgi:hypothetical protein